MNEIAVHSRWSGRGRHRFARRVGRPKLFSDGPAPLRPQRVPIGDPRGSRLVPGSGVRRAAILPGGRGGHPLRSRPSHGRHSFGGDVDGRDGDPRPREVHSRGDRPTGGGTGPSRYRPLRSLGSPPSQSILQNAAGIGATAFLAGIPLDLLHGVLTDSFGRKAGDVRRLEPRRECRRLSFRRETGASARPRPLEARKPEALDDGKPSDRARRGGGGL